MILRSLSRSNSSEKGEETEEGDIENGNLPRDERGEEFSDNINSTAANFLQGWFPYSRLAMIEDRRSEGKVTSSKCVDAFWSRVRTLLVFCSSAPYSQKDSWRDWRNSKNAANHLSSGRAGLRTEYTSVVESRTCLVWTSCPGIELVMTRCAMSALDIVTDWFRHELMYRPNWLLILFSSHSFSRACPLV